MNRAIDSISGRLHEPLKLTEENAWRKTRRYNWGGNVSGGYTMTYFWSNMISNREIEITKEEFENQSQPSL
jgi:hypothetical protein